MIKRFEEYINVNENENYRSDFKYNNGDSIGNYGENFASTLNKYLPFKTINGEISEYKVTLEIKLLNDNIFSIYMEWLDSGNVATILINGREFELNGIEGIGYDMASGKYIKKIIDKLKELLIKEKVIVMFSVVLGTEGYAEASKTFYSKEDAEEWLNSAKIIKGTQIEGKQIGKTV